MTLRPADRVESSLGKEPEHPRAPTERDPLPLREATEHSHGRPLVSATSHPSGATPGGDDARLDAVYPALAHAVTSARHELGAYAERMGINGERLDNIRLAVSEAVSNAVLHAYRGEPGPIRLTAAVTAGMLRVTVADDGCGHRTPAQKPGLGLGFGLMATVSDEFELADGRPGTQVHLVFLIDARP